MTSIPVNRREIGQTLMLVSRDFQQRLDNDLRQRGVRGISARHRDIVLFLARNGASRAVELAAAAGIRPQSMMKIVHEMAELGLIERRPDPTDSRAKLIDFTPRGKRLITELATSTEIVWQQYAQLLGEDALQRTFDQLNDLLQTGEHSGD